MRSAAGRSRSVPTDPLLDSTEPRRAPAIDLNALVSPYLGLAMAVISIVLVFLVILLVVQSRRIAALEDRLLRLTRGQDDGNLGEILERHLDAVARVVDDVDELGARAAVLESRSQRSLQRIGLVQFNPFEDTGGNQSFALALLDGRDDGIVISSLHSRGMTRIYAKSLAAGRPEGALSDEEAQAVELARTSAVGARPADLRAEPRPAAPAPAGASGA